MPDVLPSRPLVGRTHQLEVLCKALVSAQDGSGAAIFLKGDREEVGDGYRKRTGRLSPIAG